MAKKPYVAIALAVWLTWAAFAGLLASALPDKVVAGGVFGPGGRTDASMDPVTGNPANFGGVVFYSTNKPAYAPLVGADNYNPATGAAPADFARNVGAAGSGWDWVAGDIVVVVVETTRGVNGWANVNSSTSLDAVMDFSGLQDIFNGTLEAFPTMTLTPGPGTMDLAWPALTDTNGNVASYEMYHNGARLSRIAQGPSPSYTATGLSTGLHCFALAVNYQRDQSGGVYETTGRSESQCASVVGPSPWIVSTVPLNNAANVGPTADIVVTFSETIVTGSLLYTIGPSIPLTFGWTNGDTVLTFSHTTAFADCTPYTVEITRALDGDGNNLIPNPVDPTVVNPWTFTAQCPNPYTVTTTPANGAVQVRAGASVVVDFSKAMLQSSVTVQSSPTEAFAACVWSLGDQRCTTTAPFDAGRSYTVWVNGTDTAGNPILHPGPGAPNPWSFTINTPPTAAITAPGVNECLSGASQFTIRWTMSDPETSVGSLRVWLNYTDGSTTFPIPAVQDLTGQPSPANYVWTVPSINEPDVQIILDVLDGAGEKVTEFSDFIEVDSIAPTAASVPADGASDVPTNQVIVITFSEAMKTSVTEAAFVISPAVTPLDFSWSNQDRTLTVYHNGTLFQISTPYTVSFSAGAVDNCDPGLSLSPTFSATFDTGTGTKRPNAPTSLAAASVTQNAVQFTWTAPTRYTPDNTLILSGNITGYRVYRSTSETGTRTELAPSPSGPSFTDGDVQPGQTYYYWVRAVDGTFGDSDFSASLRVETPAGEAPFDWLLVLIPLIVILVIVGLFLLMRRKKPTPAVPARGKAPVKAPPKAEAPVEEPAPGVSEEEFAPAQEAEGGEKFIPCPNCGTMVKPTDAECFVCGAKL